MPVAAPIANLVRSLLPNAASISDADLLDRFVQSGDQAAFELLVWRHGGMVWGTCRRMLAPDSDAAEDACQAAFVALAIRADRVRDGGAIAAWLHRIAVRASLDLIASRPITGSLTHIDPPDPGPEPGRALANRELCSLVDDGLNRLPDKLRVPFVLCALEGRSNAEAAAELGCPIGTVESRLTRARHRLRAWLTARGVTPAIGVAIVAVPESVQAAMARAGSGGGSVGPAVRALAERATRAVVGVKIRAAIAAGIAITLSTAGFGLIAGDAQKEVDHLQAKATDPKPPGPERLDTEGLPLPAGAVARLGSPRLRHGARVKDIAYSPNGKWLASVGYDDTLRVWDAETGRQLFAVKRPEGGFDKVSFAAEGTAIVALGRDPDKRGVLWRIEVATGNVLDRLKLEATLPKVTTPEAAAVRFSSDGSRLALGNADKKQLIVIDTSSAGVIWTADLDKEVPGGVTFASDGKTVAAATTAGRIHLFDRDGRPTAQFKAEGTAELSSVALSPDGKLVTARIGASFEAKLIAWDRATGRILWTREHRGGLGLAFTLDSRIIVDCGSGYFASTIDAANGPPPGSGNQGDTIFDGMAEVGCLALHPAGKVVAFGSGSGTICLFDIATRKPVPPTAEPKYTVGRLRFSADGKTLYGWALDWFAWDVLTGKQRFVTNAGGWNFGLPLSPDGKYTIGTVSLLGARGGTRFEVCDAATGKAVYSFREDNIPGGHYWLDFTPNGKAIIACQVDGSFRILSFDGKLLARMSGHKGAPPYHAFSSSAQLMVTATINELPEEFSVRVWDLKNGKELAKFNPGVSVMGNGYQYGSIVALSGDGRRVASLTYTNSYGKPEPNELATVWDVSSGKVLAKVPQGGNSGYIALSPDGRMVAVSPMWKNDVRVYEVASGGELFHFRHAGEMTGLEFAPDGRTLAAASKEAPIYLWDVAGGLAGAVPAWNPAAADHVWEDLAADPVKAFAAIRLLRSHPANALPFLRDRAKLPTALDATTLKKLFADLASEDFKTREKATELLAEQGEGILTTLDAELARTESPEARARITSLIKRLDTPTLRRQRLIRIVEAVEGMGTAEAKSLLGAWADGSAGRTLAEEAKTALARLKP